MTIRREGNKSIRLRGRYLFASVSGYSYLLMPNGSSGAILNSDSVFLVLRYCVSIIERSLLRFILEGLLVQTRLGASSIDIGGIK